MRGGGGRRGGGGGGGGGGEGGRTKMKSGVYYSIIGMGCGEITTPSEQTCI